MHVCHAYISLRVYIVLHGTFLCSSSTSPPLRLYNHCIIIIHISSSGDNRPPDEVERRVVGAKRKLDDDAINNGVYATARGTVKKRAVDIETQVKYTSVPN